MYRTTSTEVGQIGRTLKGVRGRLQSKQAANLVTNEEDGSQKRISLRIFLEIL